MASIQQSIFVSRNGNDSTGDGSIGAPLATISYALSTISDAAASKKYGVFVFPGVYSETALSMIPYVFIIGMGGDLFTSLVNISVSSGSIVLSGVWPGGASGGFTNCGISSPLFIDNSASPNNLIFEMVNCEFGGSLTFEGRNAGDDFEFLNCTTFSTLTITGGQPLCLFCQFQDDVSVTGNDDTLALNYEFHGCNFAGTSIAFATGGSNDDITPTLTACGGIFALSASASAGGAMNVQMDVSTAPPASAITLTGGATFQRLSDAGALGYVPGTSGDWPVVPATAQAALDAVAPYALPFATTSTRGVVLVDGTTITIDGSGVISAAGGGTPSPDPRIAWLFS